MTDLIKATGLWAKTSGKTGRQYLTGRWGALRVLVFENADAGEGDPTHLLMLGEAADKRQPQQRDAPTRGQSTWNATRDHHRERHTARSKAQAAGTAILADRGRQGEPPASWVDETDLAIADLEGR